MMMLMMIGDLRIEIECSLNKRDLKRGIEYTTTGPSLRSSTSGYAIMTIMMMMIVFGIEFKM